MSQVQAGARKRVFLVTASTLFGRGVENLLRQEPRLEVVGCEADAERALQRIEELAPDAVIFEESGADSWLRQALTGILIRRLGTRVIGIDLHDSSICVYRGERRIAREVEDLVEAIEEQGYDFEAVRTEEWGALAEARSQMYGFLAAVYNRLPDEPFAKSLSGPELAGLLASMAERGDLPQEMRAGVELIEAFIAASQGRPVEELQTELAVDRTRLLRGVKPGYGPPPYESVYMGSSVEKPQMQATVSVRQAYAEAGVGLPEEMRDQPDFIGYELDFMRHLTDQEAQAWAEGNREEALEVMEKERAFLEEHIARWVPRFCEVMEKEARLGFYEGIARMTKGFVLDEAEKVPEHLEWALATIAG
jgi:TorA maturation chaperone TorD